MSNENESPQNSGEMVDRDENGRFTEGHTRLGGKEKGTKNYLTLLEEALEEEAKKSGITYWQKLAQFCYRNPMTATAILKKFLPDKQQTELLTPEPIEIIVKHVDSKIE